jgi:DNA-binding LacI/PurR family transcriptional regulator
MLMLEMNLHDVARRAGVSIATVSRVLNDSGAVKALTRARVLRAVELLDYHPNANARAMSLGNNRTLGVIVSNFDNPYFVDVVRALETEAERNGYETLLTNTNYSPKRLAAGFELMLGRRVAGIAAIVSEMAPDLVDRLRRSRTPVVVSGVTARGPNITNIQVNCRKGMERVMEHLRALGHRRVAFFGHHSALESLSDRRQAFTGQIARSGAKSRAFSAADSLQGGRQAVRDLAASRFQATAVVCANDRLALGALREFRERGIRVPADVSVTGFDNIEYSEYASPALTTVHIPRDRIGSAAFACLIGEAGKELVIDPELIVRESTARAAR